MPPAELIAALIRMGLLPAGVAPPAGVRLTGGVSSDIWRIELAAGPVCVKRALAKLKVAADWRAPTERNLYEARWMQRANAARPGVAPAVLGHDPEAGALAMAYLDPASHELWKDQLRDGIAEPEFAAAVGRAICAIHAATAADLTTAADFPSAGIFHEIRLAPYLLATAAVHPDRAQALVRLAETTAATRLVLIHGDVSPKNILAGPAGPVFLDAECATWGDPAFDLAFCLNHLLLKCLWVPGATARFLGCFDALAEAYRAGIAWERPASLEARAAALLPGLLLARVDGKSPVEYVTDRGQKDQVRRVARALLAAPPASLAAVRAAWAAELATTRGPP